MNPLENAAIKLREAANAFEKVPERCRAKGFPYTNATVENIRDQAAHLDIMGSAMNNGIIDENGIIIKS